MHTQKQPLAEAINSAILTKREAAALLRCTTRYLERQIRAGRLRAMKPTGKLVRILRRDIDAFLESGASIGGAERARENEKARCYARQSLLTLFRASQHCRPKSNGPLRNSLATASRATRMGRRSFARGKLCLACFGFRRRNHNSVGNSKSVRTRAESKSVA